MSAFWLDRPVFVTGGTGLLGSHLVKFLVESRASVVCLVRDQVPQSHFSRLGLTDRVVTVRGELEDYALLQRIINEYEIDSVFHLGAQTIVGTANRSPLSTWESNVRGTYNLLEACRVNLPQVSRVIVASSDKAYGDQETLPYDEEAPLIGRFPYDCSKSCTDLIATSYHRSFNLPVCITRCGNLFGPGDLNWNRIVPGSIRSVLRDERPVIRSNGKLIRDYLYVEDGATAYIQLAEQMDRSEIVGEAFNFSEERRLTVLDITQLILKTMGRQDLEPVVLNQAKNEIKDQYLSAAKAHRLLAGWKPRFGLDEGLRRAVDWYRGQLTA